MAGSATRDDGKQEPIRLPFLHPRPLPFFPVLLLDIITALSVNVSHLVNKVN